MSTSYCSMSPSLEASLLCRRPRRHRRSRLLTRPRRCRPVAQWNAGRQRRRPCSAATARYSVCCPAQGRLWTLRFATGQTTLEPESQAEVPAVLAAIAERAAVEVLIEGHSDQAGDAAENDALSLARAEAVRELLIAQGLTATFVRVVGRGSRAPLVDAPGQAHAQNRRVEVLIR